MIRLFKHYIPHAVLLLAAIDLLLLVLGAEAGWALRLWQIDAGYVPIGDRVVHLLVFAGTIQLAMISVGVYSPEALLSVRFAAARLVVAFAIGILALSLLYFLAPPVAFWRSNLLYATLIALAAMIAARAAFRGTMSGAKLKRRVVILGAGARAARVGRLSVQDSSNFIIVGYVAMNDGPEEVIGAVNRADIASLPDYLVKLGASEVVLALEERRNSLPSRICCVRKQRAYASTNSPASSSARAAASTCAASTPPGSSSRTAFPEGGGFRRSPSACSTSPSA